MEDEFLNIKLHNYNLDRYIIRSSIFESLKNNLPYFSGRLLDVGCGKMPYRDFILENSEVTQYFGLDIESGLEYDKVVKPDYLWDGHKMPFEDNEFDCCLVTEVLEHCPEPEKVLFEINRVLKDGGFLFFTVPFLWNLHEVPNDEFRFTPFALKRLLTVSDFDSIEISSSGGWHTSLAQMLGLWVRRSPLTPRKRKYFSILIKPIMKKLLSWDKNKETLFTEGQMIPSLYGIARKSSNEKK